MLYNLNFLRRGEIFPPREELERLEAYRVNDMLLNDEPWAALPEHKQRVLFLLSNFSLAPIGIAIYITRIIGRNWQIKRKNLHSESVRR